MDLVREILLWAEKGGWLKDAPAADELALCYHVHIMVEGGLICGGGEPMRDFRNQAWKAGPVVVKGLTWKGHEFLEAMRSETTWRKVKDVFAQHGVPFVTEILLSVVKSVVAKQTGLPLS